jgi:pimeloyl-ACP methyl ester carboxylesterase
MKLNYKKIGKGAPLIILHGLYGMADNWLTIGKQLADYFEVFLIDQRNHGSSPHSNSHTYNDMVADLLEFFIEHGIEKASILGHSMGGKTAMFFAVRYPERITRLIVADISPRAYTLENNQAPQYEMHQQIINAMLGVDFSQVKTRQDVATQMAKSVTQKRVIQFLLKNLDKDENNQLFWQLNVEVIKNSLADVLIGLESAPKSQTQANFPVLFLRAENSGYIPVNDDDLIREYFPYAEIITIFDAGHWLHAEQPQAFYSAVMNFVFN